MNDESWDEISSHYYDDVISPLKNSENNPLLRDVRKLSSAKKNVVELGCGVGELLPVLSKSFGDVTAIDFSSKMIQEAKKKVNSGNVSLHVLDIRYLDSLNKRFDLALAVNSLLHPDSKVINDSLKAVYRSLKSGGIFLAVVPAIESYIYEHMIYVDQLRQKNGGKKVSFKPNGYTAIDFPNSVLSYDDGGQQKNFYRFEILYRFKKAGFRNIEVSRVNYSWKEWEKAGFRKFLNEDPPWDWYVKCQKK